MHEKTPKEGNGQPTKGVEVKEDVSPSVLVVLEPFTGCIPALPVILSNSLISVGHL